MQKELETEKEIIGECFCDAVGQHMINIFLRTYQNYSRVPFGKVFR